MTFFFCILFGFTEVYGILVCESRYFSYSLLAPYLRAELNFHMGKIAFRNHSSIA